MFISKIHGKEAIDSLAQQIGCKAGECVHGAGYGSPGLTGSTYGIKDQLKAAGASWDGTCKAWTFQSWGQLDKALQSIVSAL